MPLADIVQTPSTRLKLSARDHARLLEGKLAEMRSASKKSGDQCCDCAITIPGYMEYHHSKGHTKTLAPGSLVTICQFCHNLRHPIWAAERKRFVPVFAPDYSQADLHRLAWTCLAWRDEIPEQVDVILADMAERNALLEGVTGAVAAAPLIEAALSVAEDKALGARALDALARVDRALRFWPAELTEDFDELAPAARVSRWDDSGFTVMASEVAQALRGVSEVTPAQIVEKLGLDLDTPDEDEPDLDKMSDELGDLDVDLDDLADQFRGLGGDDA